MLIFHSYVSLPEGNCVNPNLAKYNKSPATFPMNHLVTSHSLLVFMPIKNLIFMKVNPNYVNSNLLCEQLTQTGTALVKTFITNYDGLAGTEPSHRFW